MSIGRFAPSPTGPLHLGNLRTALVAWLFARSSDSAFRLRIEDLDRVASRPEHEASQLSDLAALGIDHDDEVLRQSTRAPGPYDAAIRQLIDAGLTYRCWCTRREIAEAARAPHGDGVEGRYPGTCRDRAEGPGDRPAALRLRADNICIGFTDRLCGPFETEVDDFVLRRNDGMPAYNLAVVVDDAAQGIEEVVRGMDLVGTTPRQVLLGRLLATPPMSYAHISLVLGPNGDRLAKRDGAVTLADLHGAGRSVPEVLAMLGASLGLCGVSDRPRRAADLLSAFDPSAVPSAAWTVPAEFISSGLAAERPSDHPGR